MRISERWYFGLCWNLSLVIELSYLEGFSFLLEDFWKIVFLHGEIFEFSEFFFCINKLFNVKWQGHTGTHPLVSSVDWRSSMRWGQARKYKFFTILELSVDLVTSMNSAYEHSDFWLLSLKIWLLLQKIPQKLLVWSLYNLHIVFFSHHSAKKTPSFSFASFFLNLSISKII
jgi:hypothetical protein